MKTDLQHKLSQALLRGNPVSSPLSDNAHVNPVSEMPMILTLEHALGILFCIPCFVSRWWR